MKQHIGTIAQVVLGIGCFAALRWFGVMSDWPNIPIFGRVTLPVSGDTVQVVLAGLAAYSPKLLGNLFSDQWFIDAYEMPTRVRELHAVKGQLVSGAQAATALGQTATVKPIEAEKPAT